VINLQCSQEKGNENTKSGLWLTEAENSVANPMLQKFCFMQDQVAQGMFELSKQMKVLEFEKMNLDMKISEIQG
jgi:hypothetical protein